MKKNILFLIPLCAVLLLSSCGKEEVTESASLEGTKVEVIQGDQGESVSETEETEEKADGVLSGTENTFPIYEKGDVKLTFYTAKDYATGAPSLFAYLENGSSEELNVDISNIVLNDHYTTGSTLFGYCDPGETKIFDFSDINPTLLQAVQEGLTKISMDVSFGEDYSGNYLDDTVTLEEQGGFLFDYVCVPFKGMKAEKQLLFEDDDVKVTLEAMGTYLTDNAGHMLDGLLFVENKSDASIPLKMSGIVINGLTLDVHSASVNKLRKGMTTVVPFNVSKTDLEDAGISSISSVALQVLTSSKQNTGSYFLDGGNAYEVSLSSKGEQSEETKELGELLLTFDDISMYEGERSVSTYGNAVTWSFYVENNAEKNIEVRFDDVVFLSDEEEVTSSFMSENEVTANSSRVVKYTVTLSEDAVSDPSVQGHFMIVTQGGSELLYYHDEVTELK